MRRIEDRFETADGLSLYWRAWLPEGEPRAVLLVAHGYSEHGDRYEPFAGYFTARGYAVHSVDHRGHGHSEGQRGHVERFGQFVDDLHAFREIVGGRHPGLPVFLVGHSLGGLIAVHYLLAHGGDLAGAVLSSPALGLRLRPPRRLVWMNAILNLVAPRTSIVADLNPEDLSHDQEVGKAYASDPLVHLRATPRFYRELGSAMEEAHARAGEIRQPILILQAGDDRLVDPEATRAFAAAVGSVDEDLRMYPGLFHEIFLEVDKERVFADLDAWLDPRVSK